MAERRYLVVITLNVDRAMLAARLKSPREIWLAIAEVLVIGHRLRASLQPGLFWQPDNGTPVDCIIAVQHLAERLPWLRGALEDARLMRVEEDADLMPALRPPAEAG